MTTSFSESNQVAQEASASTVWGLDAMQLHERFWASRGIQVVRPGDRGGLVKEAELFLLTDARSLSIFRMTQLLDTLNWLKPQVLFVRLHGALDQGYSERVIADDQDRFVRFERVYSAADWRLGRVALTKSRDLAQVWKASGDAKSGWRTLRHRVNSSQRTTLSVAGAVYDREQPEQVSEFIRELVSVWKRPDATIRRAKRLGGEAWGDRDTQRPEDVRLIGPVWVGTGRSLEVDHAVVGPAVLWDVPEERPYSEPIQWNRVESQDVVVGPVHPQDLSRLQRGLRRGFDIAFSLFALGITLPVAPFIAFAIWKEDGSPIFFAHERETVGGRNFPCLKFRTMRKDAEDIKAKLMEENQADGPQFFIENDPRISKVGKVLRKTNLDELPQFLNVLVGHMAIVGPRPSPYKENQFCPPWREARLSVRPGVTGLWQVKRSRNAGEDFQEWIRYDIEYVENRTWRMDFYIIWWTLMACFGIKQGGGGETEPSEVVSAKEEVSSEATAPDAVKT
ncbi:MAG: sugar transferase [Algisphaera sp.]